jgi:membrane-bound lytic murein transglycosylase A
VSYDGQNGHSYVSVGRKLVDYGEMKREEVSMQSIRSWLKTHPEKAEKLLETNPSYIFFHELPVLNPETGPLGAHGVSLAPGRSLAVDNTFLALGVPLWLDTTEPAVGMAGSFDHGRPLRRLVIAQDTGGAIQGPVRGDFFWGFGEDAEHKAGLMNQPGRYFLLLPKSIDPMARAREKDQ